MSCRASSVDMEVVDDKGFGSVGYPSPSVVVVVEDEVGVEGDGAEVAVLAGVPGGVQDPPGETNLA
jgi:hypothetical protein